MGAGVPAAAAARELAAQLAPGRVLVSGPAYEQARRLWNGAVDHRPALIARCQTPAEVQAAILAARRHRLPLSVRGGGHDWAGRALRHGGLVIDLSGLRQVVVDAGARIATAGGGATAGDVIAAAAPHGLAAATGTVGAVGMAGLTLGGGYGPLNGRCGLALDNLLGAEVVLADGRRASASASDDADLYWALRGGGGTFGVVTTARYRLHPPTSVLAGLVLFPLAQAATVLRGYRELVAEAPDEFTVMNGFVTGPDGQPLLFLFPTWSGDQAQGERAIARLQQLGTPAVAQVGPMAYQDALGLFDPFIRNGRHYALRTRTILAVTEDVAALFIEAARGATSPYSGLSVHHFHGAASRVPVEDTAFGQRRDHLLVEILAAWEPSATDDGSTHRRWAEALSARLAPHALPGGYPNLLGPDEHERTLLAYGPNARRLRELRRRFDPDGVFTSAVGTF